jgi:outer membrane cobalamin receptor
MHRNYLIVSALLGLIMTESGLAQDVAVPRSDIVVVTGSRLPSTRATTPVSTTVLTQEDIDARQPADTVDLLRQIPGIHIDQPGGLGGVSSIYLRGADPNYTQILIDGVQVNDPTNSRGGSFDVSSIDMHSLERVEIVRSSQSAVRGADAIAGTINFITRGAGQRRQYSAVISGGSHGYRRGSAEARGPLSPDADFALSAALIDDGDAIEGSRFHNRSISAKSNVFPSDDSSLRLVARISDSDSSNFPDDSGGPVFAVRRISDTRDATEVTVAATFEEEVSQRWRYTVDASFYRHRKLFASPGVAPGVRSAFGNPVNSSESFYERMDVEASANLAVTDNFELVAGGALLQEDGVSDSRLITGGAPSDSRFSLSRTTSSAFAEARWRVVPTWSLQAGMRVDNPDGFSTQTSLSAGSIYTFQSLGTEWKASWSEGFKLPSFFALGNAIVGDPTLRLESSSSVETSVLQPLFDGRGEIGLAVFRNYFYDSIDFDSTLNRLVNQTEVVNWGSEMTTSWLLDDAVSIGGYVTFVDTDIRDNDDELLNRPKWRLGADVSWKGVKDITLTGRAVYVGRVLDSSIPTGDVALADHTRFDVSANWRFAQGWDVSLAVDNIFDNKYEEAVGFRAPGILPRMTLRLVF